MEPGHFTVFNNPFPAPGIFAFGICVGRPRARRRLPEGAALPPALGVALPDGHADCRRAESTDLFYGQVSLLMVFRSERGGRRVERAVGGEDVRERTVVLSSMSCAVSGGSGGRCLPVLRPGGRKKRLGVLHS
jgi:hypothetical protein